MAESEKITINMNVVDLGKVDLLVDQGFYSNRTDFIRTAIRSQLETHSDEVKDIVIRKSYVVGVIRYGRKELEKLRDSSTKIDVKVAGLLLFADDVDAELVKQTLASVQVRGVLKANAEVKLAIEKL
ncbi:CopG family transcriptional regulator [Sporosarcina thermotolerans]|uniref:CopG family transcriptional regulator n=1 Tax=Sporosarcina thermotolerans TaxID=633404 RepID=A0AAW9AE96_9BACL|nr:CopG family transcriptional regulator [Sporosarcina thermotolerans]MDW0117943.1 CopG family transcriptional regulator [Sporosarcina thermotolerans]WHT49027.1 CopG family transcriptional regulator [Sporosarcina thermotolerans]